MMERNHYNPLVDEDLDESEDEEDNENGPFYWDHWYEITLDNLSNGVEERFVFLYPSKTELIKEGIWLSDEYHQLDINCQDHTTIMDIKYLGKKTCVKKYDKHGFWKWAEQDDVEEEKG